MTDGTKIALAIVLAGLLISAVLLFRPGTEQPCPPCRCPAAAPPTATAAERPRPRAPDDAYLEGYTGFAERWARAPQKQQAEAKCWAPLAAKGRAIDTVPHFRLDVNADGTIARVSYDPRAERVFPGLYPCLKKFIASVRLPPPGRPLKVKVQADRPGAIAGTRR